MQNAEVAKDRQFHMRVGAEDQARLEWLSKHYEMTEAQIVRMLIKREADTLMRPDPRLQPIDPSQGHGRLSVMLDAERMVKDAALPGVRLLVASERDDDGKWFVLTDGERMTNELDLEGVERALAAWAKPRKKSWKAGKAAKR